MIDKAVFLCSSVTAVDDVASDDETIKVSLMQVYSNDTEDVSLWKERPENRIDMIVTNLGAAAFLETGKFYFVAFTAAN